MLLLNLLNLSKGVNILFIVLNFLPEPPKSHQNFRLNFVFTMNMSRSFYFQINFLSKSWWNYVILMFWELIFFFILKRLNWRFILPIYRIHIPLQYFMFPRIIQLEKLYLLFIQAIRLIVLWFIAIVKCDYLYAFIYVLLENAIFISLLS